MQIVRSLPQITAFNHRTGMNKIPVLNTYIV